MRWAALLLTLAVAPGCTSVALKRATLAHADSSTDLRYKEVIENLAMSAANPDILPAYSSIYAGTTDVNDNVKATSMSAWARTALQHPLRYTSFFSNQTADFLGSRAVKSNWTLDPTVVPEKLVAMRAACRWVTHGFGSVGPEVLYLMAYKPAEYTEPKNARQRELNVHGSNLDYKLLSTENNLPIPLPSPRNEMRLVNSVNNHQITVFSKGGVNGELYIRMTTGEAVSEWSERQAPLHVQQLFKDLRGYLTEKDEDGKSKWRSSLPSDEDEAEGMCVKLLIAAIAGLPPPYALELAIDGQPSPPGYYFDVADQLAGLPAGWLHCERKVAKIPYKACYWARCGDMLVWVEPEGMEAFSEFVLILQKIARAQLGTAYYPRTQTRKIQMRFTFVEAGTTYHPTATVYLDEKGVLTTGENLPAVPIKQRIDNVGTNSDLKSIINASAKSATP